MSTYLRYRGRHQFVMLVLLLLPPNGVICSVFLTTSANHNSNNNNNNNNTDDVTNSEQDITVVYLAPFRLRGPSLKGRIISGAMTYAVTRVNDDPKMLPGRMLRFVTVDTSADTFAGTREMSEKWRSGSVAFFGPEDSCDVEGRVASAWRLPLFAYVRNTTTTNHYHLDHHCLLTYVVPLPLITTT